MCENILSNLNYFEAEVDYVDVRDDAWFFKSGQRTCADVLPYFANTLLKMTKSHTCLSPFPAFFGLERCLVFFRKIQ